MASIASLVPALVGTPLTALIALGVYLYRNRIAFSVVTINGSIEEDNDQLETLTFPRRVQCERLYV